MVSYQAWTSIVFDVAQSEGASFGNIRDGQNVVGVSSEIWNERKADLMTATESEARKIARNEIAVE